jgi:hypothetical protein
MEIMCSGLFRTKFSSRKANITLRKPSASNLNPLLSFGLGCSVLLLYLPRKIYSSNAASVFPLKQVGPPIKDPAATLSFTTLSIYHTLYLPHFPFYSTLVYPGPPLIHIFFLPNPSIHLFLNSRKKCGSHSCWPSSWPQVSLMERG